MVLMPLSGWAIVSTSPLNLPTLLFHVVPWPHIGPLHGLSQTARAAMNGLSSSTHLALAWSAVALLTLHVGAVLKRLALDRNNVLARMLPTARRPASEPM